MNDKEKVLSALEAACKLLFISDDTDSIEHFFTLQQLIKDIKEE